MLAHCSHQKLNKYKVVALVIMGRIKSEKDLLKLKVMSKKLE